MTPLSASAAPRDLRADLGRCLAILFVIAVHVTAPLCQGGIPFGTAGWWTADAYLALARMGVPLFFMLSGFFLLAPGREETLTEFFSKRVRKVAVPFVAWAVFYLGVRHVMDGAPFTATHVVGEVVQGPVYTHYWFFYELFGLYLVTPILRPLVRAASRPTLIYALALWCFIESVLGPIEALTGHGVGISFVVTTGYVGYFVGGRVLADLEPRIGRGALVTAILAATALTALLSWAVSAPGAFNETFGKNRAPTVLVGSVSAFLLLRALPPTFPDPRSLFGRAVASFGRCSFGIYLVHMIVLRLARGDHGLIDPSIWPAVTVPALVLFVAAVSYGVTALFMRIPVLRETVGA